MSFSEAIYPVFQPLLKRLRRSRWLIRRLFGVDIPSGVLVQYDPVTVLLAKSIPELIIQGASPSESFRILETGIGEGALVTLAMASWNQNRSGGPIDLELHGIDCSSSRVESSKQVADFNSVDVEFWISDLFADVPDERLYDLVFFNPPYVPTQTGQSLRLTRRLGIDGDQMWDGGADGTEVLLRFLQDVPKVLQPEGKVVFGVQPLFVDDAKVQKTVNDAGLTMHTVSKRSGIPAVVYVVERP